MNLYRDLGFEVMSVREKIIEFLKEKSDPVPTLAISKEIHGSKGTKKMINPDLYALQREGILVKTTNENGGRPRWSLAEL